MRLGKTDYISKNNKTCFLHDLAYAKYKDLTKKAESGKII